MSLDAVKTLCVPSAPAAKRDKGGEGKQEGIKANSKDMEIRVGLHRCGRELGGDAAMAGAWHLSLCLIGAQGEEKLEREGGEVKKRR